MKVLLFLSFVGLCIYFVAARWHAQIRGLQTIRAEGQSVAADLKGKVLGLLWLSNAIGLALSALYFYDRNVSPFFWLMLALAVNGLAMLSLYEFFPDLRRPQSKR